MSEINPGNIPSINVTLVGTAGGPVDFKQFNNGGSQAELSVAISHGYRNKQDGQWVDTGTTWVRILASGDYAENNWPVVNKGDKVRLDDARLETREFDRKDGTKGQAFEARFGTLTVVQAKEPVAASAGSDLPW